MSEPGTIIFVSPSERTEWEIVECSPQLRWRNGVLQQLWGITKWAQHSSICVPHPVGSREEWRDVPQVTE